MSEVPEENAEHVEAGAPKCGTGGRRRNLEEGEEGAARPQKRRMHEERRHRCFVVDVSGSMRGGKLSVCKGAVLDEIESAPPGTVFTLISFSDAVTVHPCASQVNMRSTIASLEANGGTALYEATTAAVRASLAKLDSMGDAADSLVVTVLTDGFDNKSDPSAEGLAKAEAEGLITRGGHVQLLQPGGGNDELARKLGVPEGTALSFSNDMHHMRVALSAARRASEVYYALPPQLRRADSIRFTTLERRDSIASEASIRTMPTLIAPTLCVPPPLRRGQSFSLLSSDAPNISRSESFADYAA